MEQDLNSVGVFCPPGECEKNVHSILTVLGLHKLPRTAFGSLADECSTFFTSQSLMVCVCVCLHAQLCHSCRAGKNPDGTVRMNRNMVHCHRK